MKEMTQAERITALEVEVASLKDEVKTANQKLDDILALVNKGKGAFWFVSTIVGGGFIGVAFTIYGWFRGY